MRCCGYDELFGERLARRDARRYRRKGLRGSARRILEEARPALGGAEVLEIGGGVGSLSLELLRAGAARASVLELSSGYEQAARELAAGLGLEERVERRVADVVEAGDTVPAADVVVLERVVCCYPDADALVGAAAERTRRRLVLSYPRYGAVSRGLVRAINAFLWLRRADFRTYAHAPGTIRRAAESRGLRLLASDPGLAWSVTALERP